MEEGIFLKVSSFKTFKKNSNTDFNEMKELFVTILNDFNLKKMSSFIFLEEILNVETVY